MVGKSTVGRSATGRPRYETMPKRAIAAIRRLVAIGLLMKISEMFTQGSLLRALALARSLTLFLLGTTPAATPATAAAPTPALRRRPVRVGDLNAGALLEPELPLGDDRFAGV